jgi:hypothetical protein
VQDVPAIKTVNVHYDISDQWSDWIAQAIRIGSSVILIKKNCPKV